MNVFNGFDDDTFPAALQQKLDLFALCYIRVRVMDCSLE